MQANEGSPLEILFCGQHGAATGGDTPVFLDRDPAIFKYVLAYLRALAAGQSPITVKSLRTPSDAYDAVLAEATVFEPPGLVELVETKAEPGPAEAEANKNRLSYEQILLLYTNKQLGFSGMNLSGYSFRGFVLNKANFSNANLTGCDFSHADLKGVNFQHANLTGAQFNGAELFQATFKGANLTAVEFSDISGASFEGSDLKDAKLGAKLERVSFEEATLAYTSLMDTHFTNCSCLNADLSHKNLIVAYFNGGNLENANFEGAILINANFCVHSLKGVDFRGANLTCAKFEEGADLSSAKFECADLTDVEFCGANLRDADFKDAIITGADFTNCKPTDNQRYIRCSGGPEVRGAGGLSSQYTPLAKRY